MLIRSEVYRPRVLVLLATYNGMKWIGEQLTSILSQSNVDVQIVVSDDGSTDGTRAEIIKFTQASSRVTLLPPDKPTGSAAANFFSLIRKHTADGFDMVALADQDDIWYKDKLHRAYSTIATTAAALYSSAVAAEWSNGRRRILLQNDSPTGLDYLFEGAGQGCTFALSAGLYSRIREFFIQHANYTQGLHYHDWAIYALTRSWGYQWTYDPQPSMLYRQHDGNDTGARNSFAGIGKRLSLIRRGWYVEQLHAIAELCLIANPNRCEVTKWHALLNATSNFQRRFRIALVCMKEGRRKPVDNCILVFSALMAWV